MLIYQCKKVSCKLKWVFREGVVTGLLSKHKVNAVAEHTNTTITTCTTTTNVSANAPSLILAAKGSKKMLRQFYWHFDIV